MVKVLKAREENSIKTSTVKGQEKHKEGTEKCLRTVYFVVYQNRPLSDYPDLIDLQEKNGVNVGSTLQSRFLARKWSIALQRACVQRYVNESKQSCVISYIRSVVCDDKPVNVFLDICELPGQDTQSICDCIANTLAKYSFDKEYLVKNLIAFTFDGASVMLGVKSGVGKRLKDQFPALVLWYCMNHRLELAVSDAVKSINGFYTLESFFNKIYSTYSFSAEMQRELKEIASKLDVELRKIGKVFTIRWATCTYRAVYALWCSFPALHEHFSTLAKDDSIDSVTWATYSGIAK